MKLTPWFDATKHNPVRVGWYDYMCIFTGLHRLLWDGAKWRQITHSRVYTITPYRGVKWRGVLK